MDDGDIGALACEEHCDGPADSGIAAGDEGDFALQLFRALVEGSVVHWRERKIRFTPAWLDAPGVRRLRVGPCPGLHGLFGLLVGTLPVNALLQ